MRKFLITLVIAMVLAVTMSILWIVCGRQLALYVDRFGTIETGTIPIKSLTYEGNGTGGTLVVNDLRLSLSPADPHDLPPHVGTTKDEQLALSYGGKVFAFGPVLSGTDTLASAPQPGDDAAISIRHSYLSWPTFFDLNFVSGRAPSWKRHLYNQLTWKKPNGAKLEMLWRYEQYFYPGDGWATGMMTREGFTGLIGVDISDPAR
jgi:hypothetical protein